LGVCKATHGCGSRYGWAKFVETGAKQRRVFWNIPVALDLPEFNKAGAGLFEIVELVSGRLESFFD